MLLRTARRASLSILHRPILRNLSGFADPSQGKKEGDISDSFQSLGGQAFKPLDARFTTIKQRLISGHEDALQASWQRLLAVLSVEVPLVRAAGSSIIPEIDFATLDSPSAQFTAAHKKHGVAIVRNLLDDAEALDLKSDLQTYIADNPSTRAFPPAAPQVFELYWSPSQMRARTHPNVLKTQRFLMQHWHVADKVVGAAAAVSTAHPMAYADRLRIRQPGDTQFALGPHVDGGSCERWEDAGYGGRDGLFGSIFRGKWDEFDPWEASSRLSIVSDLYNGAGACSAFRMYQGWLSLSTTGPGEGTLLVNPLFRLATAYLMLRPFFEPIRSNLDASDFLSTTNWRLAAPNSWLHGAHPGHGQELSASLHPHLDLASSMVSIPRVMPGDYVAWHCDVVHSVDTMHAGASDSSALYIPACPLSETNATHAVRQRAALVAGVPGPDFPGGAGESAHVGRESVEQLMQGLSEDALRAYGLMAWDTNVSDLSKGQRTMLDRANKLLGFYA